MVYWVVFVAPKAPRKIGYLEEIFEHPLEPWHPQGRRIGGQCPHQRPLFSKLAPIKSGIGGQDFGPK